MSSFIAQNGAAYYVLANETRKRIGGGDLLDRAIPKIGLWGDPAVHRLIRSRAPPHDEHILFHDLVGERDERGDSRLVAA